MKPWRALAGSLRTIHDQVCSDWESLLNDSSQSERAYQAFLRENSGFAWLDPFSCSVAISQLRFGADHVSDFVLAHERGSYGFSYQLIEIESPHDRPFTKTGIPSQSLNHALKQTRDWRHWISTNRDEAKRLFPSKEFRIFDVESFEYIVVIGRRAEMESHRTERKSLESEGLSIRSFDWLSDQIRRRVFVNFFDSSAPECDALGSDVRNALANPFAMALTDASWRQFVKGPEFSIAHMVANNADSLLTVLETSDREAQFVSAFAALSAEERALYASLRP